MTGIAVLEGSSFCVEHTIDERQEKLAAEIAMQAQISVAQNPGRPPAPPRNTTQNAARRSHSHGCPDSLPRYIADHNSKTSFGNRNIIVEITAQVESRFEPGGNFKSLEVG